jgi:signal transduction histidine kinase
MTGPDGSVTVLAMDGQARWRRPWPRPAPEVADGLLGLAVVAAQLLLLGLGVNQGGPIPFAELNGLVVALILLQGLSLTWRRRRPLEVFGVVLAANTAYYAIGFPPSQFDLGLPLATFTVAAERDRRISLAALSTVLGLLAAQWAAGIGPYWSTANWVRVLYLLFFFSAMWAWGRYVRIRRAYAEELAARAERAERDREREAGRAVAAERARIARELHDVIAHHMSVMVIQAGAARRLLDLAPDQVEDAGRRGLEAIPGLLRALREDGHPAGHPDGLAPQPTLAQLDALVAQVRAAGSPVALRIEGTPRPLPAAVDLSAYRVAQEALTNTLKHAGPAWSGCASDPDHLRRGRVRVRRPARRGLRVPAQAHLARGAGRGDADGGLGRRADRSRGHPAADRRVRPRPGHPRPAARARPPHRP